MPFRFTRKINRELKIGAHVATAGGIHNAVDNAIDIGSNCFAIFLKNPKRWTSPSYKEKDIESFKEKCQKFDYDPAKDILPHGSYFINLANPDEIKAKKSFDSFLDDLQRCESLGIGLYNFHPGSDLGSDHAEALKNLASCINRAIEQTNTVKIVLENMAGHGNLIGSDITDLEKVISAVKDKSRIGVCIDTCHTFAAGYDISTAEGYESFWSLFSQKIGFKYLSALHLNDSKAPCGANRDLHQRIGWGFLGLDCFRRIVNDERFHGLPMVLETPEDSNGGDSSRGEEIKLLEWLVGRKEDDKEFLAKSAELKELGAKERDEYQRKYDKKRTLKSGVKRPTEKTLSEYFSVVSKKSEVVEQTVKKARNR